MLSEKIRPQEFLARLPLFNDMVPAELDQIAAQTTEVRPQRGENIFRRGDPCLGFHIVIYGQVKLAFVSPQGDEKVVEIIGPGQSFGEALMFMEKPYIVSAQALADSLLLHVAKSVVFEGIEHDPGFARKMLAGMSRRLHGLIGDIEANSLRSGTQRVIGYLLKGDPQGDGDGLMLEVGKAVIASRLSLTPEHFSRILHDLVDKQLITVSGRKITIMDLEKLRHYDT
jgi:CRP-like cAMP-binding protein